MQDYLIKESALTVVQGGEAGGDGACELTGHRMLIEALPGCGRR
jgi:hypothetical protein